MKERLLNLLLFLVSLTLSIYICEFVIRSLYFMPNSISRYYPLKRSLMGTGFDVIQYEFKIKYRFNQFGFRDKNWIFDKDDKTKILILGDSFAEGFGVEEEERFGNIIADNINNKVTVYSAGQLATNPLQYYHNMIDFGIALSPKVIIFSLFMGNDFQGGRNELIKNDKTPNKNFIIFKKNYNTLNSFLSFDYLFALLSQLNKKSDIIIKRKNENIPFLEMLFNTKMNEKYFASNLNISIEELRDITRNKIDQELYKQFTEGMIIPSLFNESVGTLLGRNVIQSYNEDDYLNTFAIIKEAQRVSQNENIEFIVLIIPDIYKALGDDYVKYTCEKLSLCSKPENIKQLESLYSRLILDLNKNDIKYVDALPDLKNQPTYHFLDMHLNKKGHAVVAKRLEQELQEIIKDKK